MIEERSKVPSSAIVIGASVGAIDVLLRILPTLPASFPFAVLVVVHLPRNKESLLPLIFSERCKMAVKEAEDKELLQSGVIYFAPSDYHLLVNPDFTLSLSSDELVHFSRPSVDVLFESAATAFQESLIGVILTGANEDGASGLAEVASAGGRTIVQSPSTAEGQTMPLSAIAATPSALVLKPDEIASLLNHPLHS